MVSFVSGEGPRSVLAGVTVTGGAGTNADSPPTTTRGGGVLCSESAPSLRHCVIRGNRIQNRSADGAGIYAYGGAPALAHCRVEDNHAVSTYSRGRGGGICTRRCELTIDDCMIVANSTDHGGGIWIDDGTARIYDTLVDSNVTTVFLAEGSGIGFLASDVFIQRCIIRDNYSEDDHALSGGIYSEGEHLTILDCSISNNADGGLLIAYWGSLEIRRSAFVGNYRDDGSSGGALAANMAGTVLISQCLFYGNRAFDGGGLDLSSVRDGAIENCRMIANAAIQNGGGLHVMGDWKLRNCVVARNSAEHGAGIFAFTSDPLITNCTIVANDSANGAGFHSHLLSAPTLTNCIIRDNIPAQVARTEDSPTITYSNVQDGWPGTGNIDADPLFLSIEHDAYLCLPHAFHPRPA